MEWYHYWQNIQRLYNEFGVIPFIGTGMDLVDKAKHVKRINNWLSKEDKLIFIDALEHECDAILTCDKYRNIQDEIFNEYNIMILYPTNFLEIIADFQALWY